METPENIVGVSVYYDGKPWTLPRPNRHHNVFFHIWYELGGDDHYSMSLLGEQGFITSTGRIINRVEGLKIAIENGQMIHPPYNSELYSENLW